MTTRREQLETKLTVKQREIAYELIRNEMVGRNHPDFRTQEEIAEEFGIDRTTIYRWRTKDRNFIEYKKEVANDFLGDKIGTVFGQLMKLIEGQQPSVKGIDLYAKLLGLIQDKKSIEITDVNSQRSDDDITRDLAKLDEELSDIDAE